MTYEGFFILLLFVTLAGMLYPPILAVVAGLLLYAIRLENTRVFRALDRTSTPFI